MIPMPERERMERMQRNPRCFLYPLNEDDDGAAPRRLSRFRRSYSHTQEMQNIDSLGKYTITRLH